MTDEVANIVSARKIVFFSDPGCSKLDSVQDRSSMTGTSLEKYFIKYSVNANWTNGSRMTPG